MSLMNIIAHSTVSVRMTEKMKRLYYYSY